MSQEKRDAAMDGALGWFWTNAERVDDPEFALSGHFSRHGKEVQVQVLVPDPLDRERRESYGELQAPEMIVGGTDKTTVLLPYLTRRNRTTNWAGSLASTETFHSRTAIFGLPVERPHAVRRVAIQFRGLLSWAGMTVESISRPEVGTPSGRHALNIHLESPPPLPNARIAQGTLHVEGRWNSRPADPGSRLNETSLEVAVSSSTKRSFIEFLPPLVAVRDLVSLAHNGVLRAAQGTVHTAGDHDGTFWHGPLMKPTSTDSPDDGGKIDRPFFTLDSLGGTAGLARWIRTALAHPRAVEPIINPYHVRTQEEILVQCCQGIEYWVSAHSKTWAKGAGGGYEKVLRLIDRVGRDRWSMFVGDPVKWANVVWKTYIDLKHFTGEMDVHDRARDLAMSARLLLELAVLREAAESHKVTASFQRDHRINRLAEGLKPVLGLQ